MLFFSLAWLPKLEKKFMIFHNFTKYIFDISQLAWLSIEDAIYLTDFIYNFKVPYLAYNLHLVFSGENRNDPH